MTRSPVRLVLSALALVCILTGPAHGSCGVLTADPPEISECSSSVHFTLTHPGKNLDPGLVESVPINVRSDSEPFGEEFPLQETGPNTGVFEAWVPVSSLQDAPGVIFTAPRLSFDDPDMETIVGSFVDLACDQDGDGQAGEDDFTDLDGDGIPNRGANGVIDSTFDPSFDDDNCFEQLTGTDIANPGQADYDADNVGDACDNCPDDYNPDQADDDDDGIGDICESDYDPHLGLRDMDGDGNPNPQYGLAGSDNCVTIFSSNLDDADSDGRGDACDGTEDREPYYGIVVSAGANGVVDSVPALDDVHKSIPYPAAARNTVIWAGDNGVADTTATGDDVQILPPGSIAGCTLGTPMGDGIPDEDDNCPALCNVAQTDTDGDGIGDVCETSEEWDFDTVHDLVDNCPTFFNPSQEDGDGDGLGDACDPDSHDNNNDGHPDDLVVALVSVNTCSSLSSSIRVTDWSLSDGGLGDGDGFADPGETLTLDLTLHNQRSRFYAGTSANVVASIALEDPSLGCILDATASFGDLGPVEERTNPLDDRFQFTVAPDVRTLSFDEVREMELVVTITAEFDERAWILGRETLTLRLDLDPANPDGGVPLAGTGELFEGFEDIETTAGLVETLGRTDGDLFTDIIPMVTGTYCSNAPLETTDCSVNTLVNDWHLHDPDSEPLNAPEGGKARSGRASLHMGRHLDPQDPGNLTYGFRQLTAFQSPPINLATTGRLSAEWWHIVATSWWPTRDAMDSSTIQMRLDEDTDPAAESFGPWFRLEPDLNPYDHVRLAPPYTSSCMFDPLDDSYTPASPEDGVPGETVCAPRRVWSEQGESNGIDATNCTNANNSWYGDCGAATTWGPGFTDSSSIGNGVWVKTRANLRPFAGRRVQIRWLVSTTAGGSPDSLSYNELPYSSTFDLTELDDGWFIDDLALRGLTEEEVHLVPDGGDDMVSGSDVLCGANQIAETLAVGDDPQVLPWNATCVDATTVVVSAGPNLLLDSVGSDFCPAAPADFCLGAQARIQEGTALTLASNGSGESVVLDGHDSTLSPCTAGLPLYEYSRCDTPEFGGPCNAPASAGVVRGWSTDGFFAATPTTETRYRLRVRCSSQPQGTGCEDTTEVRVLVYPGDQVEEIVVSTLCNTAETGDPLVCDLADGVAFTFSKPSQSGSFDGFGLYRLEAADLQSPVLDGAVCVDPAFGVGLSTGAPVAVLEPASFVPPAGGIAYYLVAHRSVAPAAMAPAGFAQPVDGETVGRFLSPACP